MKKYISYTLLTFNSLTFIVASIAKIKTPDTFQLAIRETIEISEDLAPVLANLLIAIEISAAVGLFVPVFRRTALSVAMLLSSLFTLYSIWRIFGKVDSLCGCFGAFFVLTPVQSLVLNLGMLGTQYLLLRWSKKVPEADPNASTPEPARRKFPLANLLDGSIIIVTVLTTLYFVVGILTYSPVSEEMQPFKTTLPVTMITGAEQSGYTLVEFGDYECPYCRRMHPDIQSLRKKHGKRLNFVYRQLPLSRMHPLALKSAEISTVARFDGQFDTVHRNLMEKELTADLLASTQQTLSPISTSTTQAVQKDIALAKQLGIKRTPTLLLCTPDGSIYLVENLAQVDLRLDRISGR